jgi:hypothetical protein
MFGKACKIMLKRLFLPVLFLLGSAFAAFPRVTFTVSCGAENDLFQILRDSDLHPKRFTTPARAVSAAPEGSAVLLLADEYPVRALAVSDALFREAKERKLRLYVEFPAWLPGITLGTPRQIQWERFIVRDPALGTDLPPGRLLMPHQSWVIPASAPDPWVVAGRVAGYDNAVYGIPASAQPVLFALEEGRVLVATTKLSGFVSGRFAPAREWTALWTAVLSRLQESPVAPLKWTPKTRPAFGPRDSVPTDLEKVTLQNAARWHFDSGLLLDEKRWDKIEELLKKGTENEDASESVPPGDGRFGILEGYASAIGPDGRQPRRVPVRADCQAESAMVLALDWNLNRNLMSRNTASNLLDFLYFDSDLCGGPRGNPKHPAFGLIGWGSTAKSWTIANYGDDNARVMLATMLAAACVDSERWDAPLLRALLANLRTTGQLGFRGDRIDIADLERHGWRHYHDAATVNQAPMFEAYNWACFLWAYRATGEKEFLEKTKTAIRMTMEAGPDRWRWNDNSERARLLLSLAWLVHLEDTPEHRHWLRSVAEDLMKIQHPSGALPERFRGAPGSHYQIPPSNEAYGTGETPLLQRNGDPVSDQLYVSGFALLAFHEAAAVLHDPRLQSAEDKLAEYLCRIQIRSGAFPFLNGAWFRAFDFERWETWASSGDAGWGAWCIESGWGPAWTACVLGLRQRGSTLWEVTARSRIAEQLPLVQKQMSANSGEPWQPATRP